MTLDEMLQGAIEAEDTFTQTLIMFVVFEKQVRKLTDDVSSLRVFTLEKHRERMTYELDKFRKKMNIKEPAQVYEAKSGNYIYYVYADNKMQAELFLQRNNIAYDSVEYTYKKRQMIFNGNKISLSDLVKGKETPVLLGGYKR